jgi:hypothetical protein
LTNNLLPVHVPLLIDTHVRPAYTCCIESISILCLWLAVGRVAEYALAFPCPALSSCGFQPADYYSRRLPQHEKKGARKKTTPF